VSGKLALIIGNSEYEDASLAKLVTPDVDVAALAEVLRDPEIGAFDEVVALVNQPASTIRRSIAGFYAGRGRDDLLLLYFSGHGIRDDRGQLFLAVKDTEHNLLRGTAIPASYITDEMDNSRSRRQVLILDCCHSGAFAHGMKGSPGASVGTAAAFEGTGSGRVVLTATDSTQYAWEGDQVIGQAENSVFTHYLIQGLHTGQADADADGSITLDELYDYVYDRVVNETPMQKPGKWSYGQQGGMVIARNPRPVLKPVALPPDMQQTMDDPRPWVREGAVSELDRLARGSHPGLALAAREALKRMAEDDSRRVAAAAMGALVAYEGTQSTPEDTKVAETAPAEVERLSTKQVEAQADREVRVRQSKREEPQPHSRGEDDKDRAGFVRSEVTTHHEFTTTISEGSIWRLILLVVAGWAISGLIGASYIEFSVVYIITGTIAGLIIGLVLWRSELFIHWKQILLIAIGWTIGAFVGGVIVEFLRGKLFWFDSGWVGSWIIAGVIGGFSIGLVLWRTELSIKWKPILVIVACCVIGALIGGFLGYYFSAWAMIVWVISGAMGGLTVGLVLQRTKLSNRWRQILVITIGWGIGGYIGSALGSIIGSDTGLANAIANSLLGETIPAYILSLGIEGVISGALIGSIGGLSTGLMMWQAEMSINWKQVWSITSAWAFGWAIGLGMFKYIGAAGQFTTNLVGFIGLAVSGLISGVIGSAVMLSQLSQVYQRKQF